MRILDKLKSKQDYLTSKQILLCSLSGQITDIELQVNECKESLANASEDLRIMIR